MLAGLVTDVSMKMPSRRQRKAKAVADAAGHTQAGVVRDDPPHPSPIQAAVSGFYQGNYERHVAAAAAAANGVPQIYRAAMISEVTKAHVVESQIEGYLVTDLDQMIGTTIPRMIAVFDECWDGQVPATRSNDDMVMALHVTGGETIDRRGGKSTGV